MSLYQPLIPTGRVQLDEDYLNVRNNFTQLNTTYGIDHYAYDNQTANNGFHNTVTTPLIVGAAHPATAPDVPKFYAMKDGTNGDTIQYSRLGGSAVPSPITYIQSQATAIVLLTATSTPIYDFTGIARAIAKVYVMSTVTFTAQRNFESYVVWDGANFLIQGQGQTTYKLDQAGNVLQLTNTTGATVNGIFWTMQLLRVQV